MGKTYRKDKVYRKPRLNSHRDLPDFQHNLLEEESDSFEDDYYYEQLHSKEQDVERSEDEPSDQRNKR